MKVVTLTSNLCMIPPYVTPQYEQPNPRAPPNPQTTFPTLLDLTGAIALESVPVIPALRRRTRWPVPQYPPRALALNLCRVLTSQAARHAQIATKISRPICSGTRVSVSDLAILFLRVFWLYDPLHMEIDFCF
jgi:hypothetical protein